MLIPEFLSEDVVEGTICEVIGFLSNIEFPLDKNRSEYCRLTLSNKDTVFSFNKFDGVDELRSALRKQDIIKVKGAKSSYLNKDKARVTTIDNPRFRVVKEEDLHQEEPDISIEDIIPRPKTINMPVDERIGLLNTEISKLSSPYCDILSQIMYMPVLNAWPYDGATNIMSSFVISPAAKSRHGNFEGGLVIHTLNMIYLVDSIINDSSPLKVYEKISPIKNIFSKINIDRLKFKIFLHDIGKIQEYKFDMDSAKIKYRDASDEVPPLEHADYTISILREAVESSVDSLHEREKIMAEAYKSLRSHHGPWSTVQPDTAEDWLVFVMDMIECKIVEEAQKEYWEK